MTKTNTAHRDIHQEVTDRIVAALEAGTRPWQKDWIVHGLPMRSNGDPYRGINILLLFMAAEKAGYINPNWMTFKQARELGACVRKGEKGTTIVYYNTVEHEGEEGEDARRIGFLRSYVVFNVEQIDGLPAKFQPQPPVLTEADRNERAERALYSCGAKIEAKGSQPCYIPALDLVQMPKFETFLTVDGYLATLAHELVHWTGSKKRLDRDHCGHFGSPDYAFEELVAEIGAAMVCARIGVAGDHIESHAAYVGSWLKALKNDKKMIFKAATLAQAAADLVLANANLADIEAEPIRAAA